MDVCSSLQTIRLRRLQTIVRRRSLLHLRTAARIRFERHMYRERFGYLGHNNARRRSRLRLRAAVERLPVASSADICTRNSSAIYGVSVRPFALGSEEDICTRKATCPASPHGRPHLVRTTYVQGTSRPSWPQLRSKTRPTASPRARRAAARTNFGRHLPAAFGVESSAKLP